MHLRNFIQAGLCALLLQGLLPAQEPAAQKAKPISYQSKPQIALTPGRIEESNSDQTLFYTALIGPGASVVFSELANYTAQPNTGRESARMTRNRTDAQLDFWLQRTRVENNGLTVEMAEQHLAFIEASRIQGVQIEVLLQPEPGTRNYDRYFQQKPFEIAYSETSIDEKGQTVTRVIHENWMVYDGFFLASRIICPEANYPALLKEARRIWKNATLKVE